MKTNLSHILPVAEACEILRPAVVRRLVSSLCRMRQQQQNSQAQHMMRVASATVDEEELAHEVNLLVEALLYRPAVLEDDEDEEAAPLPTLIQQAWKKLTSTQNRLTALDKTTLIQYVVPHMVQPHGGAAGHMGLFDCWVYALQGRAPSSTGAYYGGGASSSGASILLPDVLILLAIAQDYQSYILGRSHQSPQHGDVDDLDDHPALDAVKGWHEDASERTEENIPVQVEDSEPGPADQVRLMARIAFRLFDSYQKKGTVTRDTLHRFLTDVHGEDSYKKPPVKALLDAMFATATVAEGGSPLQASLSEVQFVTMVQETVNPTRPSHLLLDWMASLFGAMIPPQEVPPSVAAYLDTMEHRPRPLCDLYKISENRLFEVKRRFHSLVRTASWLPDGALATTVDSDENDTEADRPVVDSFMAAASMVEAPKHSIPLEAFSEAVCEPNEEKGMGGYLPVSLAKLVFRAGCRGSFGNREDEGDSSTTSSHYWGLAQFLQFGCTTVRQNRAQPEQSEQPLLRFLFHTFQLATREQVGEEEDRRILTRAQVQAMLLLAVEHTEYRLQRDQPPPRDMMEEDWSRRNVSDPKDENGEVMVDLEACSLLGLLPPKMERSNHGKLSTKVPLTKLVAHAMKYAADGKTMSFDEFCSWNNNSASGIGPASRLGPIMVDLRLIGAVLFGVPPTLASIEVGLIAEIERRHKARYPQTSVSRRGPRGTVWYIIEAAWLKEWTHLVDEVSRTDEDADDNRHSVKGPVRGLARIDNADLLAPGGLLALRNDVRWKHDYEIIPPLAWQALQAWYDGGPPIHRTVVRFISGNARQTSPHSAKAHIPTENEIELHPFFVTIYLCDAASRGEARPFQQNFQLSRVSPMGVMLKEMCKELDVDSDLARLWVLETGPNYSPRDEDKPGDWLLQLDKNIVEQRKARGLPSGTTKGITLLLELKDLDTGKWPRGEDGREWSFVSETEDEHVVADLGDGVVGLYNMGNTCYLNSSIQCLSHTPILREYFTSKGYLKDVNTTNPLGHQGQLAQVSAVLINSLWKPFNAPGSTLKNKKVTTPGSYVMVNAQSLTPKTFKDSLGKFNELFAGNEQHDAQELLTFLLAGLSEDLNRIMDKPYIEAPDSDGRPDSELADIWWENHLKREMSIVVAIFTGQYKSLLTCRTCKYESARFEPFASLTVPLPEDDHLSANLVLYPLGEGMSAMKYCVRVKSSGKLRDVLIELAKTLLIDAGVSFKDDSDEAKNGDEKLGTGVREIDPVVLRRAQDLAVVDLRNGYIDKIAPISWKLQDIQNKDTGDLPLLYVYELDPLPVRPADEPDDSHEDSEEGGTKANYAFIAFAQRRSEVTSRDYVHPLTHKVFGTPLLIRLNEVATCTGRQLYEIVAKRLRNLVPKTALRFLIPYQGQPSPIRQGSRRALMKSGYSEHLETHSRQSAMSSTKTDDEDVSAGLMPRYGFRLRVTTRDGRRCLLCPWYRCCIGCQVPDDFGPASVMDGDSIVVDWHFAVDVATSGFGMRTNQFDSISSVPSPVRPPRPTSAVSIKNHSSCGTGNRKSRMSNAITLEECLEAFAKEEQIPEAYCSKCKDFRVQTTRMTLWRLPPILVIHLKRFQFTQTMRRKLRDLVVFPLEGLDLSKITAPDGRLSKGLGKGTQPNGMDGSSSSSGRVGGPDSLYDLYGVIHHQGALSGGHYVASLKSELDGQWRLFNDAQIYEIHDRDVVDSSAYILFYVRRDVMKTRLSDLWNVREESPLSQEEVDQLLNTKSDRCVIS